MTGEKILIMSALKIEEMHSICAPPFLTLYMAAQNRLLGLQRLSVADEIASVAMRAQ